MDFIAPKKKLKSSFILTEEEYKKSVELLKYVYLKDRDRRETVKKFKL